MFSLILNNQHGFVVGGGFNFEGPQFTIFFDNGVVEFSSDKSFSVEDGVDGVSGDLIFGGVSDQSFRFGKGDIRGGGSVTLVVSNNFDSVVLPDSDTRVGGS